MGIAIDMDNLGKLFPRTYNGENNEQVVVIGNRSGIAHDVEKSLRRNSLFKRGGLIDCHVVRFKPPVS